MNFQIVGFCLGILLSILGAAAVVPALLDAYDGHRDASVLFAFSLLSFFFGGALVLTNRGGLEKVTLRDAFLLTTLSWVAYSALAALPFCFSEAKLNFFRAFFESSSGLTTTGATVIVGLDHMPRGLLMWRAITTFIGGNGIIAFALVMLPFLGVGGMQIFRTESSDKSGKPMAHSRDIILSLVVVNLILNALCILTFYALGMSLFDAVTHAFGIIATAGFSTHDASFGYFQSYAIDMAAVVYMFLSCLPFILFAKIVLHGKFEFFSHDEVRLFTKIVVAVVGFMTLWLWHGGHYSLAESFRYVSFNVVSVISTAGYANHDYMPWGPFAWVVFLLVTYLGGCAGSTAGGIKMMRFVVAFSAVKAYVMRLIFPNGTFTVRYQRAPVPPSVVQDVLTFLCLYVVTNVVLTLAVTATGVDFITAVSAAAACIGNVGPGVGAIVGPAGNYAPLPDSALFFLSIGMILGRLEIMTVLVLFLPSFWRN